MDYDQAAEAAFMPFLEVLITPPLKEFTLHTQWDVGDRAWSLLNGITGIRRLSVWSLDWARPRLLDVWAPQLGPTLTQLELGVSFPHERLIACALMLSTQRCSGIPPAILILVFSQLPLLQDLRVNGIPSAAIPSIMACLPKLIALDTEYQQHGNYHLPSTPLPHLQRLTIRTSSVDVLGPEQLWNWICSLIPYEGSLLSFSLGSFAIQGLIAIPLSFVTRLIRRHGQSLTRFRVGIAQVTHEALVYLCRDCPALASLECSVASANVVRQVVYLPSIITKRLLGNDRKSYRTRQESLHTPVIRLVDTS